MFASSGGAVNALALVAKHPEQVSTLVAHEPPAAQVLPDREHALAACADIHETYLRAGMGPAMAKFIAIVSYEGPIGPDYAGRPAPDPRMFGLPAQDDGSRNDPLLMQNMVSCTHYQLDFKALKDASTRIVIAVGAEGASTLANRAGVAVAARLGKTPVIFRATTAVSLAASTASMAIPMPSRPPSAKSSPPRTRDLPLASEVIQDLGHHAAVDLVVARDLAHDLGRAERHALAFGLDRGVPRARHRARAVGEPFAPERLDVTEGVQRARDRLERERERAAHDERLGLHDLMQEIEPGEHRPLAIGMARPRVVVRALEVAVSAGDQWMSRAASTREPASAATAQVFEPGVDHPPSAASESSSAVNCSNRHAPSL
jgi:hypothetical protein